MKEKRHHHIPLIKTIIFGISSWRQREVGAKEWADSFTEKVVAQKRIQGQVNIDKFREKLDHKDGRWLHKDVVLDAAEAASIWIINPIALPLTQLLTGDVLETGKTLVIVHGIVRTPPLIVRAGIELHAIVKTQESRRKKIARFGSAIIAYPALAAINLAPGFAYFLQPLISLPRNTDLVPIYFQTEIRSKILQAQEIISMGIVKAAQKNKKQPYA